MDDIPQRSTSLHTGIGLSPVDTTPKFSLETVNLANSNLASLARNGSTGSAKLKGRDTTQDVQTQKDDIPKSLSEDDLTRGLKQMALGESESSALQKQRDDLVTDIKSDVATRKDDSEISPEKRAVFEAAGMGDTLKETGTLEVQTRWMKPVIHVSQPT